MERPNHPAVDDLEALIGEIADHQERIAELKEKLSARARSIFEMSSGAARLEITSYAYWYLPEVNTQDLIVGMLGDAGSQHKFRKLVGPLVANILCGRCKEPIPITSRTHMATLMERQRRSKALAAREAFHALCDKCHGLEQEQNRIEFEQQRVEAAARTAAMQRMPYAEYLETSHWKQARAWALSAAVPTDREPTGCEVCSSTINLDAYHKSMRDVGLAYYGGVRVLCRPCSKALADAGRIVGR